MVPPQRVQVSYNGIGDTLLKATVEVDLTHRR